MTTNPSFAVYYAGDAYSTSQKIMGRQSAGKAFMNGMARKWSDQTIHGYGPSGQSSSNAMLKQLQNDGFKGTLEWLPEPALHQLSKIGALYYPAPPSKNLAYARNCFNPRSYSIFGVTHTLSSAGAMDQVAELVTTPFQNWDALICTSQAALIAVRKLQDSYQQWLQEHLGATKFCRPQMPVIPLGIHASEFIRNKSQIAEARKNLNINPDEIVFLFAGRLSFHAKANPAPLYQALEKVAQKTHKKIVCIEAGVFPNQGIKQSFTAAQQQLAPSVRHIWQDGQNNLAYQNAWQAADVFASLSDNIQETFGLTPVEAMAAGLPILASDWNGYRDTIREGVDGFRVPTILPPRGTGNDLALCHALGIDTYDFYIGKTSMATVIDTQILEERIEQLVTNPQLRYEMGQAGQKRAIENFDWPIILERYQILCQELAQIRGIKTSLNTSAIAWPNRPDPFDLFAHFSTQQLTVNSLLTTKTDMVGLENFISLNMTNYIFSDATINSELLRSLFKEIQQDNHSVGTLVTKLGGATPVRLRAILWLAKLNLINIHQPS